MDRAGVEACKVQAQLENLGNGVIDNVSDATRDRIEAEVTNAFRYGGSFVTIFDEVTKLLDAIEDAEKIYAIDPAFEAALSLARKSEFWDLTNVQLYDQNNFSVEASSTSGILPYIDVFTDACPEFTLCASFKYPRLRPLVDFTTAFTVRCVDDSGASVLCRNTVAVFGDGNSEGGTLNNPTEPFNGDTYYPENVIDHTYANSETVNRYLGTVSAADYDGAYLDYDFQLDLGEAQPEITTLVGQIVYAPGADVEQVFQCGTAGQSISKSIQVTNTGRGTLYWATPTPSFVVGAGWSLTGLESIALEFGGTVTGALRYDCATPGGGAHTWQATFSDTFSTAFDQDVDFSVNYTDTVFRTYSVCLVANGSCSGLRIYEGIPGDGKAIFYFANHPNFQGVEVALADNATSISASGGPIVYANQRTLCEDGVYRFINIAVTSDLSIDLTGGSNGSVTDHYDYGSCKPGYSQTAEWVVENP